MPPDILQEECDRCGKRLVRLVALPGAPGQCRSCGAHVRWVELHKKNGKRSSHPVNASVSSGPEVIVYDPPTRKFTRGGEGHASHFSTCPQADSYRTWKGKERGARR